MAVFMLYSPQPVRTEIVSVNAEMLASGGYVANQALIRAEPIETILQVPLLAPERLALPAPEEFGSEESIFDERLIALNEPDSPKMGPYKSLLSNLQVSIADSHTRIVLVGSSRNQSGKTTLLANTSILLAQAGYSVLMIDANFRNPALHKVFDLQNKVGLSDGLKGANSTMLMQKTCVKNLSLISTGTTPTNPTEFLGSPEMIELLAELKRKVEVILIDTPALLEFPDAGVLAGHTGGIVFLHNENEESEDDIRSSKKLLKKIRARILGYVTV
jgi:capsular exopolysaccharide synthesis family protein